MAFWLQAPTSSELNYQWHAATDDAWLVVWLLGCLPCCPWVCSPRQVLHAALERHGTRRARTFLRRLAWRDLAYWALWRFPWMPEQPLRCGSRAGKLGAAAGRPALSPPVGRSA